MNQEIEKSSPAAITQHKRTLDLQLEAGVALMQDSPVGLALCSAGAVESPAPHCRLLAISPDGGHWQALLAGTTWQRPL